MGRGIRLALMSALLVGGCEAMRMMPDSGQAAQAGRGAAVPGNLRAIMNDMNSILYYIKMDAEDPTKLEQNLQKLAMFQRDLAMAKLMPPGIIAQQPPDKRAETAETYRRMMSGITRKVLEAEEALLAKKFDTFRAAIKEVEKIEAEGHMGFAGN